MSKLTRYGKTSEIPHWGIFLIIIASFNRLTMGKFTVRVFAIAVNWEIAVPHSQGEVLLLSGDFIDRCPSENADNLHIKKKD